MRSLCVMFVAAVCILFLVKLKWPKNNSVYDAIAGFQCHAIQIDQNKNQNRSIDKVQNLGNERRQICKDWYPYGHQHGGRKLTETSVTEFCDKSENLSLEEL